MDAEDLKFYGEYAPFLIKQETWLAEKLQQILDAISTDPELKPTEHILHRIKSSASLKEKLKKKELPQDPAAALRSLSDIIGVRLVVHFTGDVYDILDALRKSPDWEVAEVKDYITRPKKNGYRSLHVILKIPFGAADLPEICVEVQLRTIAMDCWASLEHQLRYKKNISNPELVGAELDRCAAEIASLDLTMQTIREMLMSEK